MTRDRLRFSLLADGGSRSLLPMVLMRLFVAIAPSAVALDELEAATMPLRDEWPQLRWTDRPAWHITLAFLGEVDEPAVARLAPQLEVAARGNPALALSVAGSGAFPGPARARVLWTGIAGDRDGLGTLAAAVATGARDAGAPPPDDGRGFTPHLTLARCRAPADVHSLVAALAGYSGRPWAVTEIHLIRSLLGTRPRYEVIGTWPLCGLPRARPQAAC
jgi:RNA 2',3'-cyclic 3'-phosphodiesterase